MNLLTLPLSSSQFIPVASTICDALNAIHSKWIIHCYVTPYSILYNASSNEIKLTNFIFARKYTTASPPAKAAGNNNNHNNLKISSDANNNSNKHSTLRVSNTSVRRESLLAGEAHSSESILNKSHRLNTRLRYLSPEQAGRMEVSIDFRSDIYSMGMLRLKQRMVCNDIVSSA